MYQYQSLGVLQIDMGGYIFRKKVELRKNISDTFSFEPELVFSFFPEGIGALFVKIQQFEVWELEFPITRFTLGQGRAGSFTDWFSVCVCV